MAKIQLANIDPSCAAIELSYLDLVSMLYENVQKDIIPQPDKRDILILIEQLGDLLEPYSA